MSTKPQYSPSQTPAAAAMQDNNRSLTNLRMELDRDVDLLKYIPCSRATFQSQNELQGAAADRLLFGDMMEEKDQLWIYFTLLGGGRNYNKETGSNRMISFHTLKGAQNGDVPVRANKVQDVALASAPFKFASNSAQVIVRCVFEACRVETNLVRLLQSTASSSMESMQHLRRRSQWVPGKAISSRPARSTRPCMSFRRRGKPSEERNKEHLLVLT